MDIKTLKRTLLRDRNSDQFLELYTNDSVVKKLFDNNSQSVNDLLVGLKSRRIYLVFYCKEVAASDNAKTLTKVVNSIEDYTK